MTIPGLLFGFMIASLIGLLFHIWRGGGGGRLLLYLILAWIGFWIGNALGNYFNWTFFSVGILRVGMASIGSIFVLILGYFLSKIETGMDG